MNSDTLFDYLFQPPQVFVATTVDLRLVIENPATGNPIVFTGGPKGDEIDITFPVGSGDTDLVNTLMFTATSLTENFTCALATGGRYFSVKSPLGATVQPGDRIEIKFSNVVINGATGNPPSSASILIQEYIGSDSGSTSVNINKLPAQLGVIAWLDPLIVALNQPSTLYWQSMGGIGVEISGFPTGTGSQKFPVSGQPSYPGDCKVSVPSKEPQRTYTVKVYTGDNKHTEVAVTLTQQAPMILSYDADKGPKIGAADVVSLSWRSLYGSSTAISTPVAVLRPNFSPVTVNPGKDIVTAYRGNFENMPATVNYPLTVDGYEKAATAPMAFEIALVGLAYFKFGDKDGDKLSGVMYQTNPADWGATGLYLGDVNTFTIYQPGGGTSVFYLGAGDTVHPQIQYFDFDAKGDNLYSLTWITANLRSLVLNPGNIPIAADAIQKGTQTVTVTTSRTYTLTGTDTKGQTVVSLLKIENDASKKLNVTFNTTTMNDATLMNDPNCTVTITANGAIPNKYKETSKQNLKDASNVIAQLTFDDIWRNPPFRINEGSVRLDVQGAIPGGGRNWQVQVNNVKGSSTISAVVVQGNLAKASTPDRQSYVASRVRAALVASLNGGEIQNVDGPCN